MIPYFRLFMYLFVSWVLLSCQPAATTEASSPFPHTVLDIEGEEFWINGQPTYAGKSWQGHKLEGLLFNSRMVQGTFDDENPETVERWKYPDTGEWDPNRNTREFVAAMPSWYAHGLRAFTLNLQGGSPMGYGNKNWRNSAFTEEGTLKSAYMDRVELILNAADSLGLGVMLGIFYFGQDQFLTDETAVIRAVDETINWLFAKGYRNVLIEVNNECNVRYDHPILQPERVHELIERVKAREENGYRFLVSTSYGGGQIPRPNVVAASDYLLLHGNGVSEPDSIRAMVAKTRAVAGYRPMPIVFNEDDHFDFDQPDYNLKAAVDSYASWGFFDFRGEGEDFSAGFQSVPVDWGIAHPRKKGFFEKVKEMVE